MRAVTAALVLAAGAVAADEPSVDLGLTIEPDLRLRLEEKHAGGGFYDRLTLPAGIERAGSLVRGKLKGRSGRFAAVAQADVLLVGMGGRIEGASELSDADATQPMQVQLQSLYVEAKDLLVDGLDARLGQQVISWGVGDQFNPTNNLNPDDLRDPLLFGRQVGNFMLALDYWAPRDVEVSAVAVPVFRPAVLPFSVPLGLAAIDRIPFLDEGLRHRVEAEMAAGKSLGYPTVLGDVRSALPDLSADNVQVGARVAVTVAEQDLSLSYYRGRTDFPQPLANHTRQVMDRRCNPEDGGDCIMGTLVTDVTLHYPRMQVLGMNLAGELASFGYRVEAALIVPERADITLTNDALVLGTTQPAGEYDYDNDGNPGGPRPAIVDATPFAKWTVGVDRAIGTHVYLNGQWVHGLVDEYGAGDFLHPGDTVRASSVTTSAGQTLLGCALPHDGTTCAAEVLRPRLGDYAVLGVDVKLMNEALLLRLFSILDLSGSATTRWDPDRNQRVRDGHSFLSADGFSALLYPELRYRLERGLGLSVGALLLLGKTTTKFGDPAAGGSLAWLRLSFSI